jgi:hypothetical protein
VRVRVSVYVCVCVCARARVVHGRVCLRYAPGAQYESVRTKTIAALALLHVTLIPLYTISKYSYTVADAVEHRATLLLLSRSSRWVLYPQSIIAMHAHTQVDWDSARHTVAVCHCIGLSLPPVYRPFVRIYWLIDVG